MPNTIVRTRPDTVIYHEGKVKTGETINPGYLVEGTADAYEPHGTAAGTASPTFAIENSYEGKGTETAYAAGSQVYLVTAQAGAVLYAKLAANATAVTAGNFLESAGDGTLRKVSTDSATSQDERASVVAKALEDVDNSSGDSEAFIKIEVI